MAFADYGRVRSVLRKLALDESLHHVWQFSLHIATGQPLAYAYRQNDPTGKWNLLSKYVFPHELDLLARELLLHADRSGRRGTKTLAKWVDLADVMNALKGYANDTFDENAEGGVLLTLHRIAHQQFPFFGRMRKVKFGRILAMYRSAGLKEIFERNLEIDVDAYFVLAFGVIASSLRRDRMNTATDYAILGVEAEQSKRFFRRIVGRIDELRAKLIQEQRLNHCWEYTFNALHFKPLVALHQKYPEHVYCPLLPALERRLLEGVYYDLCRDKEFALPYGSAVEEIVQRILDSLKPQFQVERPLAEQVGKARYDGADFIVSQGGEFAFIECKAKRVSMEGRVAENLDALDQDLGALADGIAQNYANIHRYRRTHGADGGRQYFCVVITLEDWFLFSLVTSRKLHEKVGERLGKRGLPVSLTEQVPYRVLSFETAQRCCAILQNRTMTEVFGLGTVPDDIGMGFANALQDRFPDADRISIGGFEEEFSVLLDGALEKARGRLPREKVSGTKVSPRFSCRQGHLLDDSSRW